MTGSSPTSSTGQGNELVDAAPRAAGRRQPDRGLRHRGADAELPAQPDRDAVPVHPDRADLPVPDEPDAGRRLEGHAVRQVQGEADHQGHAEDDVRRRRRCGRGGRGAPRDQGVPAGPGEVPGGRRQDPQGRAALRRARHRQDAARPRRRRRGRGAVLLDLRLGLRRDVRRRRRVAGSATSSSRPRRTRRRSSSSTRSTPSAGTAARVSAAATTSASRRSTSCWSRWTASTSRAA